MITPTVDFDHHSTRYAQDGPGVIRELHAAGPLVYTSEHGGFWVTTSFEVSRAVLTDPEIFSSLKHLDGTGGVTIPTMGPKLLPAETDPPYHTSLRRALAPLFSKQGIEAIRGHVEKVVDEAVDGVIVKRDFDVADDLAWVVAPLTIVDWLGLPGDQRTDFIAAVRNGLSSDAINVDPGAAIAALADTADVIVALIDDRRANPRDDLTSVLVHQQAPALDDEELLWLIFTLLLGGIENTAALITNALLHISEHPDIRQRLLADDSLIAPATEEFLRFYSPGVSLARIITRDVELAGCRLKAGDRILVLVPAANHDATAFENPEVLDIERKKNPHLAFGGGAHYCVGVWLARMEFHYMLRQVLARIPDFTVDRSGGIRYEDAGTMNGWSYLPACTNL